MTSFLLRCFLAAAGLSAAAAAQVTFSVVIDAPEAPESLSGRLVIGLIDDHVETLKTNSPLEAPIWDVPQPMFGADLRGLERGKPSELPKAVDSLNARSPDDLDGPYRIAARLITGRATSSWKDDEGNFFGEPETVVFTKGKPTSVTLHLSKVTHAKAWPAAEAEALGVELIEVRSKLLSDFHKRDVMLRAGVVKPKVIDPANKYAAIYEVPGFGGRHFDALRAARTRQAATGPAADLAARTFWIVLDPESPNGHTLFADSANNGPCGQALTQELIPAIEAKYPMLVNKPVGRLLRGHSSGGWSTLWLLLTYPDVFGATWSTSPDPVDFRRFELADIYGQRSFYSVSESDPSFDNPMKQSKFAPVVVADKGVVRVEFGGRPREIGLGSFRRDGKCVMTVEQEAKGEDVLGPDNTSGQQWDSWMAVWAPRNDRGHPAALFNPATGRIDDKIAQAMKGYDIGQKLRNSPATLGPIFRTRVHLAVGSADSFYLNEAVQLLKNDLNREYPARSPLTETGYIEFVQGADHGTIFQSELIGKFPQQMTEYLDLSGALQK
jgi:hypothetical protein